jgi:glycosyltransferase involved in cell wall biosynthesis
MNQKHSQKSNLRSEAEIMHSWTGGNKPLVSIVCPTYNHERFVHDAIEGFLAQITLFPFEIIIHDDASTDSTVQIVRHCSERFPRIIRTIFQRENQFSKGRKILPIVLSHVRGRYVALCEGDDYWTDPFKLQKQKDFLYENPSFSTCIHNVKVIYEDLSLDSHPHFLPKECGPHTYPKPKQKAMLSDLMNGNFIPTPSVMFRSGIFQKFPPWFDKCSMGDWPLHVLNTKYGGGIGYLDEMMGVYRVHSKGLWSSTGTIVNLLNSISSAKYILEELSGSAADRLEGTIAKWHEKIIDLILKSKDSRLLLNLGFSRLSRIDLSTSLRILVRRISPTIFGK